MLSDTKVYVANSVSYVPSMLPHVPAPRRTQGGAPHPTTGKEQRPFRYHDRPHRSDLPRYSEAGQNRKAQ